MSGQPLYYGKTLRLTALEAEKDAPVVAGWTYEPETASRLREGTVNPMTPYEVRRILEGWIKDAEDNGRDFVFGFRPIGEERLVGFLRFAHVQWVHGAAIVNLVIGEERDWEATAREALEMALNYAFDELNLFRVTMRFSENDLAACRLVQQANFTLEVRQRQALYRSGRYVDRLSFGMLRPEWEVFRIQEVMA